MTAAVPVAAKQPGSDHDRFTERLWARLDAAFLADAGWNAELQVLVPPKDHPVLGYRTCPRAGCQLPYVRAGGLCYPCELAWKASGLEMAAFMATPSPRQHRSQQSWRRRISGEFDCEVAGCQRPATRVEARLCHTHASQRRNKGLPSVEAFLARPDVQPRPSLGACRVASCIREAVVAFGLCSAHYTRWRIVQNRHAEGDLASWSRRQVPLSTQATVIVLRGLPPLVQAEMLYGLQERCGRGHKTKLPALRSLCRLLHETGVASILELDTPTRRPRPNYQEVLLGFQAAVARVASTPEAEQHKDVWNMGVFGHTGILDFTVVSQGWLRTAIKLWVAEELPKRRGDGVVGALRDYVASVRELSASLRSQRSDQGETAARLGRSDIVAFTNRLAHLEAIGKLTLNLRIQHCRRVAKLLRDFRAVGFTRPDGPLAGLPDDVTLRRDDIPEEPDADRIGRALPKEILGQLIAALPQLQERHGREAWVAVRLLMDTGRRPDEICALPWDCLEQGADGKFLLVYTNFKANRVGRRLPISDAAAALIREQQQAVRDRFPDTPLAELVLLPRVRSNPTGSRPSKDWALSSAHRRWLDELGPLRLADGTEFDKAKIVPYVYRHCYAQRHADAGTPVDVLCELMDHRSMDTTQGYYNVTEKRTRQAVDQLVAYQVNGRGERVWQQAQQLLDHEHQRLRVGQVAVPYGTCSEPSNVQAGGGACPFRFRCAGCAHFRTDPSYLPELRGYLDRLLADRERVAAATELEDWARAEALPSQAEIGRVRALIRKIEQAVEDLTEEEQQLVAEATRTLRATRS